jgi:hypothetical protein
MTVSVFDEVSSGKRAERLLWSFDALLTPNLNRILPLGQDPPLGLRQITGGG